ncbi:troponin C [Strongylocentrotus purpuratus]|uniref:EF-hand domain-containing protein n=1 Tax=Strongylocentrotus purpuratus TaxID=7668 RepID=A0A7M7GI24_STRPU|nr:troponin C [Strongylocentrotus purpuratus]|eukprot:XP_003727589.1 PREDICTED: troponin C, isoform 3 [Strongylocentrotus purpuratus]
MGLNPSFPIPVPKTIISFEPEISYNTSGVKKKDIEIEYDKTGFESATEKNFQAFVEERKKAREARERFEDLDALQKKFTRYTLAQLETFKFQFMSFDINQDGLIDYHELQIALDELGDSSTKQERRLAFDQIDVDHSDSIDFEEFIELLTVVSKDGSLSDAIGKMCKRGTDKMSIIRTMSVDRQLQLGLF